MPKTTIFVHVGQRIGRGVVIDANVRIPRPNRTSTRAARLVCDCGNEYVSAIYALAGKRSESQRTQSCGCLRRERQIAAVTKHGMAAHPLYRTWDAMLDRCENPSSVSYKDWGGRGITVCERWHDVTLFIADIERDLGPRPDDFSLNRIDNDGNYEPGNVEWASWVTQANNRRPMPLRGPRGPNPRPYSRTCEQCGNPFQASRPVTLFCSKACKAAHRRAARKDDIEQTCHQCGDAFSSNRYDGVRHCSQSCAATCQHAGNCPAKEVV